jgi:hypothetical protein
LHVIESFLWSSTAKLIEVSEFRWMSGIILSCGFEAAQRCVAKRPVLIFLQVRAGRVKLIEFLRDSSSLALVLPVAFGTRSARNESERERLSSEAAGRESDGNAQQPLCLAIDIAVIYGRLRAALISLDNYTKENLSFH